jgi:hypothetical protein
VATWNIAGQVFSVGANTVIFGHPQPGDWVSFEGRLQPDGTRIADRIVLANYASEHQFNFIGTVESINNPIWLISGRTVQVDEQTVLETGLAVGDHVEVTGRIANDGRFWATALHHADDTRSTFRFAGILTSKTADQWTISGLKVTVNASTTLSNDFNISNLVLVEGVLQADGKWVATAITLVSPENYRFELVGVVQSLSPWTVSGVSFDIADETEIDTDIQVGDEVRVVGLVKADGRWVAERIEKRVTTPGTRFDFFGPVLSFNPWNVGGISLTVNASTTIKGDITLGEMVKVTGWILADGTWLATDIKHTGLHRGQGCFMVSSVVRSLNGDQIILLDGQTLTRSEDLEITGDLKEASLVRYRTCVDHAGLSTIGQLIVVYQLNGLPLADDFNEEGGKAIICHYPPGNPGNRHTIEIGQPAVPAHLAHGDTLGPCPSEKPGKKNHK